MTGLKMPLQTGPGTLMIRAAEQSGLRILQRSWMISDGKSRRADNRPPTGPAPAPRSLESTFDLSSAQELATAMRSIGCLRGICPRCGDGQAADSRGGRAT
jgi:hypothetical protein